MEEGLRLEKRKELVRGHAIKALGRPGLQVSEVATITLDPVLTVEWLPHRITQVVLVVNTVGLSQYVETGIKRAKTNGGLIMISLTKGSCTSAFLMQ
jgi:uncharacterized membrane protein YeiH